MNNKEILYGKDVHEWLKRWDQGETVWSISMGGLGPGYEQAIQVTVVELIRHFIKENYDMDRWVEDKLGDRIWDWSMQNPIIKKLGLSGAQYGAATNLAAMLYKRGPIEVMEDPRVKDRQIQVSKMFP